MKIEKPRKIILDKRFHMLSPGDAFYIYHDGPNMTALYMKVVGTRANAVDLSSGQMVELLANDCVLVVDAKVVVESNKE